MRRDVVRASFWGATFTIILGALIVFGSRNLTHFDAALVGYTFATLFATESAPATAWKVLPHLPATGPARRRLLQDEGERGEQARCKRCERPFASAQLIRDLITVERELGFRYEMNAKGATHYQEICPACQARAVRPRAGRPDGDHISMAKLRRT